MPSILSQEEEGLAGVKMIALAIAVEPSPILTVSDTEVFHSRAQILELGLAKKILCHKLSTSKPTFSHVPSKPHLQPRATVAQIWY